MRVFAVLLILAACSSSRPAGPTRPDIDAQPAPDPCDLDGDGARSVACGGDDCNDQDPAIRPAAVDTCGDGIDQDCDGVADRNCVCVPGQGRACYPPGLTDPTRHVGACRDGTEVCNVDGTGYLPCDGAVVPAPETCDGVDQNCDGHVDEGLTNSCAGCGPAVAEICGNGLDDDCNGVIDDPTVCSVTCEGVDSADPGSRACCLQTPPAVRSFICVDDPSLPACASDVRLCLSSDGTACTKACDANKVCVCGVSTGPSMNASPACGFETPCAHLGCEGRTNQPCYSGPPATRGVGTCHGGTFSCTDGRWGQCQGEVVPVPEICGNEIDDDCDGVIDEEDGTGRLCATACTPAPTETCNGLDETCDGLVDEGCRADTDWQACYPGPAVTENVGACKTGVQTRMGSLWGPCLGYVLPAAERCGDLVDSNCDGFGGPGDLEDPGCHPAPDVGTCNGVPVSECGRCDDTPCFEIDLDHPGDCDAARGRTCLSIAPIGIDDEGITIAPAKVSDDVGKRVPLLLRDLDQLAAIEAGTGALLWVVDSLGDQPWASAMAPDGTIWLANRGFAAPEDPRFSNVVHLDKDGNVLCRTGVPGTCRGVAVDRVGHAFGGSFSPGRITEFDPAATSGLDVDGFPQCATIDLSPDDPSGVSFPIGTTVYDLAIDARGILWNASNDTSTARFDTNTLVYDVIRHNGNTRSVSIDEQGNAWFGGTPLHRISADGPYVNAADYEWDSTFTSNFVQVGRDGKVWAGDDSQIVAFDPHTLTLAGTFGGAAGGGVAQDALGIVWGVPSTAWGSVYRLDPTTGDVSSVLVKDGARIEIRGDASGVAFLRSSGRFSQVIDTGYPSTRFRTLSFQTDVPAGASALITVRLANTVADLDSRPACGPFTKSPADLTSCYGGGGGDRYARIDVALSGSSAGPSSPTALPAVSNIRLTYDR